MTRGRSGFALLDVLPALVVLCAAVVLLTACVESLRLVTASGDRFYGHATCSAIAAHIRQVPYGGPYAFPAQELNPRGWAVSLEVQNYLEGAEPPFDDSYPESGLQRVVIRVESPNGRVYSADVYKSAVPR